MSVQRVAARYAKALVDIAQDNGKLDAIHEDITSFMKVHDSSREFQLLVKSPIVKGDTKQKIFDQIFSGKIDEITFKFFGIVINKGRESYLPAVADAFLAEYKRLNHISTVKLRTASKLSDKAIEAIKAKLTDSSITDTNVELEVSVDESLIGGFVVEFGDKLYDASVASKLNKLRKEFSNNTYIKNY